jgi:hypothetical protein
MIGLIRALLSIAGSLTSWAQQRQLIDAGAAQATLDGIRDADANIAKARAARDAVDHSDAGVRNDPDNRDR